MSENDKKSPPPSDEELGGMAGALARALQDRSKVIQVSGKEELKSMSFCLLYVAVSV